MIVVAKTRIKQDLERVQLRVLTPSLEIIY
jgi:hypothetical protein